MKQFFIDYLKGLVISFGIPILLFLAAGLMGGCTRVQSSPNKRTDVIIVPYLYAEEVTGKAENGMVRSANLRIVEMEGYRFAVLTSPNGVAMIRLQGGP